MNEYLHYPLFYNTNSANVTILFVSPGAQVHMSEHRLARSQGMHTFSFPKRQCPTPAIELSPLERLDINICYWLNCAFLFILMLKLHPSGMVFGSGVSRSDEVWMRSQWWDSHDRISALIRRRRDWARREGSLCNPGSGASRNQPWPAPWSWTYRL